MVFSKKIGKYQIGQTIGEGMFAKVKLAVDTTSGRSVAVKIIDKSMVSETKLMLQVQREIRSMKLLKHPNIVQIFEVLGTKTKIYIVMEYIPGGQLSDKMAYSEKLSEPEARKLFQQLIDAVDHCHSKGVYHRDLKPENLLLDNKGNLKITDFGLSALRKQGDLLSTACGSPSYVAPEVQRMNADFQLLMNKAYDGASADIWSCGVILFELLAGHLPFEDRNLMSLYRKICRAQYNCPEWFTESQKKLITRLLEPYSVKRITIPEIVEDPWFQNNYVPSCVNDDEEAVNCEDVNAAFDSIEENVTEPTMRKSSSFINAFRLIAMSNDLDLSGLFKEESESDQKTRLGSKHTLDETVKKIETAATDVSLSVERLNNFKMRMLIKHKITRFSRSYIQLSAEVTEVAPTNCVIEISKSAGEIRVFKEFCNSLSNLLTETSDSLDKQEIEQGNTEEKTDCSEANSIKPNYVGYLTS